MSDKELLTTNTRPSREDYPLTEAGDLGFSRALIVWQGDAIDRLTAERDRLKAELDNVRATDIHSCHDGCQRPACVMRRERDALKAENERLRASHEPLTDHMAALIDSAYYEGAKLALIKADESIQVAREWLAGGCNGRRQAALAILRHAPPPRECYHEDRYAGWVCVGCGMVMGECPPVNQPVEQEPDYLATLYALLVRRGYAQDEAHSIAFGDRQEDITQCEFCRNYHWPHCPPSTKGAES